MSRANATGSQGDADSAPRERRHHVADDQPCESSCERAASSVVDPTIAAPSRWRPRRDPLALEAWSVALVALLRVLVIAVFLAYALSALIARANAIPLALLVAWALRDPAGKDKRTR
jgi:hypothetical protein